jgi:PAS domain S-box-containing protein
MSQKIKILHLEDTPTDAELIERELKRGKIDFEKIVVSTKADFENALKTFTPDVILSDHSLHSFDSHEALQIVKREGIDVPFILVTAAMSDEFAVNVMKEGAYDYIIKDRLNRLPKAVLNSIERHRLEDEQKMQQQQLMFHIENAPLGFIEWNHMGFLKSWSKRTEEIFGWSEEKFIQTQSTAFIPVYEEDLPWVSKSLEQLIQGEVERNKLQYRNVTKDGTVIWCEWFNSVLKDADGKVKTIMSLVQNITDKKLLEIQKDNFLSILSHELNTPLTTIKAYGEIVENMLAKKGDGDTLSMLKKMDSQVNRLSTLVLELLDFTRIQNGKFVYNEKFFDFNELVTEVIDDMQKINSTHKIKYDLDKTVSLFGDRNKMAQVFNNLISNAVKYSPAADSVVIKTKLHDDGIQLSVQDFGIGIPPQDQPNVFDQFYRVNRTRQSTFPGMGIGLYICSEIVKNMSGKIWVESAVNEGSTFHAWFPIDHRKKV